MAKEIDWKWYLGSSDEYYDIGSFDTKEEALKEAENYDKPLYLCRAKTEPVLLSDWFDVDDAIENAEDSVFDNELMIGEYWDDLFFNIPQEALKSLKQKIKLTIDKWQKDNNLVFIPNSFTSIENEEIIED